MAHVSLRIRKIEDWKEDLRRNMSFIESDVFTSACNLIGSGIDFKGEYLVYIETYIGTQDEKKEIISDVLKQFDDERYVIITDAYVSTDEFPEDKYKMAADTDDSKIIVPFDTVIERESKMLEGLGFIDINHFVGYEYKKAYIYNDRYGNGKKIDSYFRELQGKDDNEN